MDGFGEILGGLAEMFGLTELGGAAAGMAAEHAVGEMVQGSGETAAYERWLAGRPRVLGVNDR